MKFVLRKKLISNIFTLFLKSNDIIPVFDRKHLIQTSLTLKKLHSLQETPNIVNKKSNYSADFQLYHTNTEKTNVISLRDKLNYLPNEESEESYKESYGDMLEESNPDPTNSKIMLI